VTSALGKSVLSVQVAGCQYHASLRRAFLKSCILLLQVLPIRVQDHMVVLKISYTCGEVSSKAVWQPACALGRTMKEFCFFCLNSDVE
jgi:hypothetical protein